jgi:hypothetical protein
MMTNDTATMRQQARTRQQKLRDFHRRNRLKKHGTLAPVAAAATPKTAADENGKEEQVVVLVVEEKLPESASNSKTTTAKTRKAVAAAVPILSNDEKIESRWALTPSQKRLSALVSPTLPYHRRGPKVSSSSEGTCSISKQPDKMVSSQATTRDAACTKAKNACTKAKKEKQDSIPIVKCTRQPASENTSQSNKKQEGARVAALMVEDVLVGGVAEKREEDLSAAAYNKAAPGTLETSQKSKCLEVAVLNAATCPDASLSNSPEEIEVTNAFLTKPSSSLLVQEMSVYDMSKPTPGENKVVLVSSSPKEHVTTRSDGEGGGGDEDHRSEQPVDSATEDTMTTQSTSEEQLVESSDDSDHHTPTPTPAVITFDTLPTKEETSSSIFSFLTPQQTITDSAVIAELATAAQHGGVHHLPWNTTPDVAPGDDSSGCDSSPRTTKPKKALVALAETTGGGEDETTGWETILSRNSSSIKDKPAAATSCDTAAAAAPEEQPSACLATLVLQRNQKPEESPEQLLVEEKKMEDEDFGGYVNGRTGKANFSLSNSAWRAKPPLSSNRGGAGGGHVVKGAASFDILSSITGSYDLQSLGQSEDDGDKEKVEDNHHKEDEGSAMLRPSSSNVSYELRIVSRMIDCAQLQLSSKVKQSDAAAAAAKSGSTSRGRDDDSTNDDSCSENYGASTRTSFDEEGPTSTFMDDADEEFERTLSGGRRSTMENCRSDSTGFVTDEDSSCDDGTSVTPTAMESMDGDDECSELTPRTFSLLEEEDQECDNTTVDTDLHQEVTRSFSFSAAASGSPDDLEMRRNDVWSFFYCPFMVCTED